MGGTAGWRGEARDADGGMGKTAEKKTLDSKNIEK
jgi:hypothetical protein